MSVIAVQDSVKRHAALMKRANKAAEMLGTLIKWGVVPQDIAFELLGAYMNKAKPRVRLTTKPPKRKSTQREGA